MKLTLFAALMVAFATETTATSVGHHALDNFDDDAVLFGEIYNFDAPPAKTPAKKPVVAPKKGPAKKGGADSADSDSDSDSDDDGGADSGSDGGDDDSGSDSDDDKKAAPKKGGADSADSGSDSDSDSDEDEGPKKAPAAKKLAVAKAIMKKPTIEGGKGSLPP